MCTLYIACGGDAHKPAKYCEVYGGRPLRRVRWPAKHIYCGRCIRPAEAMHKYFAVLRDLMALCEVLRNKLLRFQSFMLTFLRFYGRLHAKMTIKLYINKTLSFPQPFPQPHLKKALKHKKTIILYNTLHN